LQNGKLYRPLSYTAEAANRCYSLPLQRIIADFGADPDYILNPSGQFDYKSAIDKVLPIGSGEIEYWIQGLTPSLTRLLLQYMTATSFSSEMII
jgi:hypothetical protein